jgi:hypothetical protein
MNMTTVNCTNSVPEVWPELGVVMDLVGDAITIFRRTNMLVCDGGKQRYTTSCENIYQEYISYLLSQILINAYHKIVLFDLWNCSPT